MQSVISCKVWELAVDIFSLYSDLTLQPRCTIIKMDAYTFAQSANFDLIRAETLEHDTVSSAIR